MLKTLPFKRFNSLKLLVASTLALLLSACASPAQPEAMVPSDLQLDRSFDHSIRVTAVGGKETNPMWASRISNQDLATAIATAIRETGLFAAVVSGADESDYVLEIAMVDLDQPAAGFDMTVTLTTSWTLTEMDSGRIVFQEYLDTPYTATVGDAFAGVKRLRLANEGAARENITLGLTKLAEASFAQGAQP